MSDLIAVGARARGLALHLMGRRALEELAGLDLDGLARALSRSARFEPIGTPVTTGAIESAIRRTAARHVRSLARWSGSGPVLDVWFAEEDRRSLRALLRGAVEGAPSEARLAGLIPTPWLPEGALLALSREPTPAKVAAHLFVLGHPSARRVLDATAGAHPVLFDLELALLGELGERTMRAARAGDANLVSYAREQVDAINAELALLLAGGPRDVEPASCFVRGGKWLSREAFVPAAGAPTAAEVAARLSRALARTPLSSVLRDATDAAALETAALRHVLERQRRIALVDPLGSATLLRFLSLLRAESIDLLRLVWGASLGAPAALVRPELVTPWS